MTRTIHTIVARLGLRLERVSRGWTLADPTIDGQIREWHRNLGTVAQRLVKSGGSSHVELTPAEAAELHRIATSRGVPCPTGLRP